MTLKTHLLNEKVSKYEIDQALSNPNVRIGAEFEFLMEPNLKDFARMFDEYHQYYTKYLDWEENLADTEDPPKPPKWMVKAGFNPYDEDFPTIEDLIGLSSKDNFKRHVKNFLAANPKLFKFGEITIANKESHYDKSKFTIKTDGSLGPEGIEITTPPMSVHEFLDFCPRMFTAINTTAKTNDKCGFHIGLSLDNVPNLKESIDETKLMVMFDEGYVYKNFDIRRFNLFTISVMPKLLYQTHKGMEETLKEFIFRKKEYVNVHHDAINLQNLYKSDKYIEFRYIGGANYQTKWNRVRLNIAHYIHALSVACDPEYKQKEFYNKISRLYYKILLLSVTVRLNKPNINDSKEYKPLLATWKALSEHYKIDINDASTRFNFESLAKKIGADIDTMKWDFS